MVAIPGQFDAHDAAPDPVAMRRLAMFGMLTAAASAMQLAAMSLKRIAELEEQVGTIDSSAAQLVSTHVSCIEQAAAMLTESATIYQG